MQVVFAKFSLRKHAWRNPKEGRVGCLHQDIFTRKVTDIAFTSDFCNNYSHSVSPASLYLTSPRPHSTRPRIPYLMSWSPSSRVPKSQVPTHASLCPRPLVPVPLLYTAPKLWPAGHQCNSKFSDQNYMASLQKVTNYQCLANVLNWHSRN